MKFCRGRLFDHVHLVVANLESSRRFYGAAIGSLGLPIQIVDGPGFFYADELFVVQGAEGRSKVHVAFQAADRDCVARFYRAALEAGGTTSSGVNVHTNIICPLPDLAIVGIKKTIKRV